MKSRMSLDSSPILPDPGYSKSAMRYVPQIYVPRVKPEAESIAALHQGGTIKQVFQTDLYEAPYKKPRRNYIRENIHNVRKKAVQRPPFKTSTESAAEVMMHSRPCTAPSMVAQQASGDKRKDFISLNKKNAGITPNRLPSTSSVKRLPDYQVGEIPAYLQRRKKLMLEEKMDIPDPTIPDGHIVMATEDRINTLQVLQNSKRTLTTKLLSLPIVCDTLKHKQTKMDLESKLGEIDDAIKIFSRPKVFIKL